MTEPELIKTNRLFAEFMGYNVIPYRGKYAYDGNKYGRTVGELKTLWGGLDLNFTGRFTEDTRYPFNTEFNYLIPIIRRIEELGYVVSIAGISYKVYRLFEENNPIVALACGDLSKKTEITCDLLLDFIAWYNVHNNG